MEMQGRGERMQTTQPQAPAEPPPGRESPGRPDTLHPAALLGSSFAFAMGLFAWLGHQWDERSGRAPLGVLLGVGMGFAYGGYEVWKLVRKPAAAPPRPKKDPSKESIDLPRASAEEKNS